MVVGILQVELAIDGSASLKDKRRVVASLKERLHRHHRVSVAEVDRQDDHRTAVLGVALVGCDRPWCQAQMDGVLNRLRAGRGFVLCDHRLELLSGR